MALKDREEAATKQEPAEMEKRIVDAIGDLSKDVKEKFDHLDRKLGRLITSAEAGNPGVVT